MSETIPCLEPRHLRAGDTAKWARTYPEYAASDGWSLSYVLLNGSQRYTFDATADGDGFSITVAATTTSTWTPGMYHLFARLTSDAGEVVTMVGQDVEVQPDITAPIDDRTQEEKELDLISEVILTLLQSPVIEASIGGRSWKRADLEKYKRQQQALIWVVARQRGRAPNTVGITFGRPQ